VRSCPEYTRAVWLHGSPDRGNSPRYRRRPFALRRIPLYFRARLPYKINCLNAPDLADLITSLARDAVAVQETLDRAYEQNATEYAALVARTPEDYRPLMQPLEPSRQVLRGFEISVAARFGTSRSIGFSLTALPLNIGYSIRFRTDASSWSNLRLAVEQVPVTKG